MIRAACSLEGGSGSRCGWRGLRATFAGFDLIQSQRTAAVILPTDTWPSAGRMWWRTHHS